MATGFQQTVNLQQAAAVAGDFASANPRNSVVSHEGFLFGFPNKSAKTGVLSDFRGCRRQRSNQGSAQFGFHSRGFLFVGERV